MNSKTIFALTIVAMVVLCTVEGRRLDKAAKRTATKGLLKAWLKQTLGEAKLELEAKSIGESSESSDESSSDSTSSESAGSLSSEESAGSLVSQEAELEELLENIVDQLKKGDGDGNQGVTEPW